MLDSLRGLDPRAILRAAGLGLVDALGPPTEGPRVISQAGSTDGVVAVRDGYRLERVPNPTIHRRDHAIHDLGDVAAVLQRLADPAVAEILVDTITLGRDTTHRHMIRAILNPRDSDRDELTYWARHHARWIHWRDALDRWMPAAELREIVLRGEQDTAEILVNGQPTGERQAKSIAAQLRRIKVTANAEVETEIDDLGMVVSEVRSGTTTVSAKIPATFRITLPVVQDLDLEVAVDLHVRARVEGGRIQYQLTASLGATEHAIRLVIRDRLRDILGEDWAVLLGSARMVGVVARTPDPWRSSGSWASDPAPRTSAPPQPVAE